MTDWDTASLQANDGAYALYFQLTELITLPIARLGNPVLESGTYVYAGSACGPGGIRARVSRHLRANRKPHWHIDGLSNVTACTQVETYPG